MGNQGTPIIPLTFAVRRPRFPPERPDGQSDEPTKACCFRQPTLVVNVEAHNDSFIQRSCLTLMENPLSVVASFDIGDPRTLAEEAVLADE
jgi:hypothetical protein